MEDKFPLWWSLLVTIATANIGNYLKLDQAFNDIITILSLMLFIAYEFIGTTIKKALRFNIHVRNMLTLIRFSIGFQFLLSAYCIIFSWNLNLKMEPYLLGTALMLFLPAFVQALRWRDYFFRRP